MIRIYSNKQIYKNLGYVKILSIISLVLSALTAIMYTCYKYLLYRNSGIDIDQIMFYIFVLLIPLGLLINVIMSDRKKMIDRFQEESKYNNDFSNLLSLIVITFIPYILLILYALLYICFRSPNPLGWAYFCGYMLPAHLLVYIADIFLIQNCILIKQEWKDNPPQFLVEEQTEIEQKKATQINSQNMEKHKALVDKYSQNMEMYKALINKCGMRFFIKYYKQIKRLPLRDVNVTENYSSAEREERLKAAKEIIDLNLDEFTLTEILNLYSDILDDNEKEQAKTILTEIQTANQDIIETKIQ